MSKKTLLLANKSYINLSNAERKTTGKKKKKGLRIYFESERGACHRDSHGLGYGLFSLMTLEGGRRNTAVMFADNTNLDDDRKLSG